MNCNTATNYRQYGIVSDWTRSAATTSPAAFVNAYEQTQAPLSKSNAAYYASNPEQKHKESTGGCCNFPALRPFFAQHPGNLLAVNSTMGNPGESRRRFCVPCAKEAHQAVEMNPGLRIRDDASGVVYESRATGRAFAAQDMMVLTANVPMPTLPRSMAPANGRYGSSTSRFEQRKNIKIT